MEENLFIDVCMVCGLKEWRKATVASKFLLSVTDPDSTVKVQAGEGCG
jgi:hypothetical protein